MLSKLPSRLKCLVPFKSVMRRSSGLSSRGDIYHESLDDSGEVDTVSNLVDRYFHVSSMQEQVLFTLSTHYSSVLLYTDL